MKRRISLLPAVMLACLNGVAQQPPKPSLDFRVIAQPGMTIGGHTFTPATTIQSVALNDAGQVAFIARWIDAGIEHVSVLATDRIIIKEGDGTEYHRIASIPTDATVEIDNQGHIAYAARYSDIPADAWADDTRWGIFVDQHLVVSLDGEKIPTFTLTDGGNVMLNPQKQAAPAPLPSTAPKTARKKLLDLIPAKPPQQFPVGNTAGIKPQAQAVISGERPASPASPFPGLLTNRHGQVLIPVNFSTGGFILLLGTPVAQR
jgi:hypothetical protein